jgi:hypothetical protein
MQDCFILLLSFIEHALFDTIGLIDMLKEHSYKVCNEKEHNESPDSNESPNDSNLNEGTVSDY